MRRAQTGYAPLFQIGALTAWLMLWVVSPVASQQNEREAQPPRLSVSGDEVAVYLVAGDLRVVRGEGPRVEMEVRRGLQSDKIETFAASAASDIGPALWVRIREDRVRVPWLRAPMAVGVNGRGAVADDAEVARTIRLSPDMGIDAAIEATLFVPDGQRVVIRAGAARITIDGTNAHLTLHLQEGHVDIRGPTADLVIRSAHADVDITGPHADVEVFNSSGAVEIQDARMWSAALRTGSGPVALASSSVGNLRVETLTGSIAASQIKVERGSIRSAGGSVAIADPIPAERLEVHSSTGHITVHLPGTAPVGVDALTRSGKVIGAAPLPGMTTSERRGSLRRPGFGLLLIRTGSGDIHFAELSAPEGR